MLEPAVGIGDGVGQHSIGALSEQMAYGTTKGDHISFEYGLLFQDFVAIAC